MVQLHPHLFARKRKEPFPARSVLLRLLDRVIYIVGIVGPLMTIPQLAKIFLLHDASGVSLYTWGGFTLLDIPWILYGVAHRERPIVMTYTLWFFFNGLVFLGALLYGNPTF